MAVRPRVVEVVRGMKRRRGDEARAPRPPDLDRRRARPTRLMDRI